MIGWMRRRAAKTGRRVRASVTRGRVEANRIRESGRYAVDHLGEALEILPSQLREPRRRRPQSKHSLRNVVLLIAGVLFPAGNGGWFLWAAMQHGTAMAPIQAVLGLFLLAVGSILAITAVWWWKR